MAESKKSLFDIRDRARKALDKALEVRDQAKDKAMEVRDQAVTKALEVKDQAMDKAMEIRSQAEDAALDATVKALDARDQVVTKALEVKDQAMDKAMEVRDQVVTKALEVRDQAKDKAMEVRDQAKDKAMEVRAQAEDAALDATVKALDARDKAKAMARETAEVSKEKAKDAAEVSKSIAVDTAAVTYVLAREAAEFAKDKAVETISAIDVSPDEVLRLAMKLPSTEVDREEFLFKELRKHCPSDVVTRAIDYNPAYAGISRETINAIADRVINSETKKVSAASFAAGLPGGTGLAATIPADTLQYFAAVLRTMQKLAYLYGFPEFDLDSDKVDDDTMNQIMLFMGVMFDIQSADPGVQALAETAAQKLSHMLAENEASEADLYPIVKSAATAVGMSMTKHIIAKGASKIIPIVGGAVSGGLTYASFKPGCVRLQKCFMGLDLCDPEFYRKRA